MTKLSDEVKEKMDDHLYLQKGYVLNGIAYHEQSNTLLLTGKYWPFIYQVELLNFSMTY